MIFLEIAMLVIGLGAVIYSFRMTDQEVESTGTKVEQNDIEAIEKKYQELENKSEETFEQLEDKISQMSNEKIIGMSEYSDQVLDKIEKNHAEVVFMYDMLNEKQEEMKNFVVQFDSMKADLHDEAAKEFRKLKEQEENLDRLYDDITLETVRSQNSGKEGLSEEVSLSAEELEQLTAMDAFAEQETTETEEEVSVFDAEIARIEEEENQEKDRYQPLHEQEDIKNHNDEILALYKKGRSVLDISKMLSLGQGEVKLVIDMYNARK